MSVELVVVIAAFLLLIGWFLDALIKEESLLVTSYVYLIDGKWRDLPETSIIKATKAFDWLFGRPWTIRCCLIVPIYSFICNFLILEPYTPTIWVSESDARLYIMGVCLLGALHDLLSFSITVMIMKLKQHYVFKLIIDILLGIAVFISSCAFFDASISFGYNFINKSSISYHQLSYILFFPDNYVTAIYELYDALFYYHYDSETRSSYILTLSYGVPINIFTAITATFPTLCFIIAISLSIFLKFFLVVARRPAGNFLDWISKLPPKRVGLVASGLAALIVFLQAWTAFLGISKP